MSTEFNEDRIISVYKDIESGMSLLDSLSINGIEEKQYSKYINLYKNSSEIQGKVLFEFFNSLKQNVNLINVDDKIKKQKIYTLELSTQWFLDKKNKVQMFGTYLDYGDQQYLLHIEVGTKNLHIGLVKYKKDKDLYEIIKMDEDDFEFIFNNYNNKLEDKLIRRNWGNIWCSVDCGEFIDLSKRDKYFVLSNFFDSDINKNILNPLVKNLQKEYGINELQDKYIFTPGPVKMSEDILAIGAKQTPYFRNQQFSKILLECEENLLKILNAPQDSRVLFFTASGTAGMEASVNNLISKEDETIVINGGGFGQRFVDICKLHNIKHIDCKVKDDNLSDTSALEQYKNAKNLLINAHETSVGLLYDLESIGNFCKKNNILNIVDGISMFVTDELDMQKFNIDALILSSQKGLALPPGITMVVVTPSAIKNIQPQSSVYFDFKSYIWDGIRGQTPFTPAVTILLQLHLRLKQIVDNGINNEISKAKEIASYFRESIKEIPLQIYSSNMPNAMTTLTPTDGKNAKDIVKDLDEKYDILVTPNGGELKNKIFRVSHMGAMTKEYTDVLIDALHDYYMIKRRK